MHVSVCVSVMCVSSYRFVWINFLASVVSERVLPLATSDALVEEHGEEQHWVEADQRASVPHPCFICHFERVRITIHVQIDSHLNPN